MRNSTQNFMSYATNSFILRSITAILCIQAFASCTKEGVTSPEFNSDFFPLQTGNKWVYESGEIEWTQEVTGRKIINYQSYFVVVRIYEGIPDTAYYRINSSQQVIVNFEGKDYLYIDFNKPVGEIWEVFGSTFARVRNRDQTVTVPAGTYNGCTEIFFDNSELSDLYEFNFYAPGTGLILSVGFRRASRLKSAVINGIEIPGINPVLLNLSTTGAKNTFNYSAL